MLLRCVCQLCLFAGVLLFSGFETNFTNVVGLILSLVGSVGYTANKVIESRRVAGFQPVSKHSDEEASIELEVVDGQT